MNQVTPEGKIKMTTLDQICLELEKIKLLKIDVEGYELSVLKGSKKTLKKSKYVFIELLDGLAKSFTSSSNDVIFFLNKQNFRMMKDFKNGNFLFKNKNY